jgi:hypothetical protein
MSLNDSTSNGLGKRSKWTAVRTKALLIHSEKLIHATDLHGIFLGLTMAKSIRWSLI